MAQNEGQEKTEQPTGKKLSDARDKGEVAKSTEISSFAVFSFGMIILYVARDLLGDNLAYVATMIFGSLHELRMSASLLQLYFAKTLLYFFITLSPFLIGLMFVGLAANIGQVGFKLSPKAFKPKLSKFNPISGIKRLFFSSRSYVELLKTLLKLILVGGFTYIILEDLVAESISFVNLTIPEILAEMVDGAYSLIWKVAILYLLIAASDFIFQKYKFKKDMMMTKQEVKEEQKQVEGDPLIKSKIRSLQFEAAKKRMFESLPEADVVITNPTHYAIAIKYDPAKNSAPVVLAKGVDSLAQKIKKIATENNIPLHEDRELARALYKVCDIGDAIPEKLFHAVAKVLAYIYNLKKSKKKSIV
jgi:flagellar biosynthetic protein FlhB